VRKVRTASGAVAVQVVRKDRGRVVILAHVGSAHTDAELGILLDEARQIVTGEQEAFDLTFRCAATAFQGLQCFGRSSSQGTSSSAPFPPLAVATPRD